MSVAQRALIAVSSFISVLGSATIIYRFVRCRNWDKSYDRLVFGLAVSDLIFSATLSFAPALLYPATEPSMLCTFEALFKHFGFAGPYYNASLSFYYVLVIVFKVNDRRIARLYEPILHAVAIPFALLACVVTCFLQVYNPSQVSKTCWISTYPPDCGEDSAPCTRGNQKAAILVRLCFVYVPLLIVLASLIINNTWIFCYVRKIERLAKRHTPITLRATISNGIETHASQVASQSFCFVFAYFLSFLPSAILEIVDTLDSANRGRYYVLDIIRAILYPMQGLFNVLVYVRPRYLRWRKWSGESRLTCFYHALLTFEAPTRRPQRGVSPAVEFTSGVSEPRNKAAPDELLCSDSETNLPNSDT